VNDLDIEGLLGSVLRGALGGGRKRKHGALSYLAGGRSSFLNASTLLTVAGVAWGLWESAQASSATPVTTPAPGAPPAQGLAMPPPIPGSATAGSGLPLTTPPPLPGTAPASGTPAVPPDVLRVLRLTLAAARADGTLEPRERDAILTRARELGAEPLIAAELDAPRPIAEVVAGVSDPQTRQDLYTLAFAVVRADESLTESERTWLAGLAGQLGLDATTVEKLEQHAASRITAAAEGAQH
jgi:tellurite resistance protein